MTRDEALSLVKKLAAIYPFSGFMDGQLGEIKREQYVKQFITWDFATAEQAIDSIIENSPDNKLPMPAQIYEEYKKKKQIIKENLQLEFNKKMCYCCMNNGFVMCKVDGYEYMTYCTDCEKGKEFAYDGRTKERKTEFYVEPVSKYLDINKLKEENIKVKQSEPIPMPEYVRKLMMRFVG